ncbi:peptidase S41 [Companilactobacillus sp. RD055328]|uniref:S41 family peptidase n=1 Tax=Companilactobacillus sp. RD055328 TaxID=2916634 RepID=UPI001FC8D196|nr:S41 family peptidase [Companilactobacillus sp. RD055328]GKQ42722.1 peptidase S41 [Companilactobacillus sp. RD055328]
MKKRFNLLTLLLSIIGSLFLGIIITITAVIAYFNYANTYNQTEQADLQRFTTVYNDLNKSYYKKTDSEKLINSAISGMVSSLNDPYTEYISAENMESFNNNISGDVSGIGVVVSTKSNEVKVVSVVSDSPADHAGLKADDVIVKIDNKNTSKMTLEETSKNIQGKSGTSVKLTINRGNKTFTKKIVRKKLTISSIEWKVDKDNKKVGYVLIKEFTDNTAKDLKNALKKLDKRQVERVIIDLRGNPGGQLDQAVSAAGLFLKNGSTVVSTTDRSKEKITYKVKKSDNNGYKFKKPVSLLVDKNSASAAEVFTAALNENIKTPIIGETTYGKGIVQTIVPVDTTSEFKLTTAKWLTPNNNWIHHKGIKPTIAVKSDPLLDEIGFTDNKTYQAGDKNDDVKFAQKTLSALGYQVDASGEFNEQTVQAINKYQKEKGLEQTSKLDKNTKESILVSVASYLQDHDNVYQTAVKTR